MVSARLEEAVTNKVMIYITYLVQLWGHRVRLPIISYLVSHISLPLQFSVDVRIHIYIGLW